MEYKLHWHCRQGWERWTVTALSSSGAASQSCALARKSLAMVWRRGLIAVSLLCGENAKKKSGKIFYMWWYFQKENESP